MKSQQTVVVFFCLLICIQAFGLYRYDPIDITNRKNGGMFHRKAKSGNGLDLTPISGGYPKELILQDLIRYLDDIGRRK